MNLTIGTITAPNNQLVKDFSEVTTLSGVLRENSPILDPVITVEYDSTIATCNYAYISDFGRYYYINDKVSIKNGLWELHLHVDVLMSYAAGIKAAPCIVAKSASNFNLYLADPNYKAYQNDHVIINNFPSGFDLANTSFVLTAMCETDTE